VGVVREVSYVALRSRFGFFGPRSLSPPLPISSSISSIPLQVLVLVWLGSPSLIFFLSLSTDSSFGVLPVYR
jgi:hypothetical protein